MTSTHRRRTRRTAAVTAGAVVAAALATTTGLGSPGAAAAPGDPVSFTDTFDGTGLDDRYEVVAPAPGLSVSGGKLRIDGPRGDTYQTDNSAKNLVMVDIPAGDFTATVDVAASVTKQFQGAGLIAWRDFDNYVRAGLTHVGALSPAGTVIETDRETGGAFTALPFAERSGSTAERLRLQRTGDTVTSSYWNATANAWVVAGTTTVGFEMTQVGLYALGAQDGTVTSAVFDDLTVEHAAGATVVPDGSFVLQATGEAPYLVDRDGALGLSADQPATSLRLRADDLGDGTVGLRSGEAPLVLVDGALRRGATSATPTPMRISDVGGGELAISTADGEQWLTRGAGDALVAGEEADAVRFLLSEVDDSVATLDIDGDGTGAEISDTMYGIFYEDINYAADGGLYAELVRNRSFEFNATDAAGFTGLTAWQVLNRGGGGTTATVVDDAGRLNQLNRNYLRLTAAAAGDGVRNVGFNNGIVTKAGAVYDAYVWARTTTAQTMTVRVEDNAGTGVLATGTVAVDGSGTWKKYPVTLTATGTSDSGRLAVLAGAPSTIALDMVSVMPRDTWVGPVNGRSPLRKDLMEKVAAMDPRFLRFPGGCVTNVGTFKTYEESGFVDRQRTYQWKETIGPVEERPTNKNFWGYNQTYGIGYLEYFEMAEDLGAEPLPVVSVGANGCGSTIPEMKDPALIQRWVDDTVDLIEFANGDVSTEWGAKRAELGHPEPFGLDMIGLGNEENTTTFEANFPAFRDAIEAKYPDITIISNSGPDDEGARFEQLWDFNRDQDVDMVDEHYYNDPDWFLTNNQRYDSYDREGPKVFLGEYASRGNTWGNALAEASYMTGLERNADVVRLASYAPLLANESHVQWNPDAIWFDNDESWESVNWEVQKLFGTNVGDEVAPSTFTGSVNDAEPVDGGVFLSTWSTRAAYDNLKVTDNATQQVLFEDGFADASRWAPQSGTWSVTGGRYEQASTTVNDARSIVQGAYAKDWSNYTLELDATKIQGAEGFLVGFAAGGPNDYYWWNLGGWGNTRSVLQRANGGSANAVKAVENTSVNANQTYRLKIVVDGSTIKLYRDGVLEIEYQQPAQPKVFQVTTRDTRTGDLVAKVVNTAPGPVRTTIRTSGVEVEPTATVTTLVGAPGTVNTKTAPNAIKPRTRQITGVDEEFEYELPGSSVTFLRMGTADGVAPLTEVGVAGQDVRGWYAEPTTVRVTATDDRDVDRVEVKVDDGPWQSFDGDSADVVVRGHGRHTVQALAVDAAGNVGAIRPVTVAIDTEAPVTRAAVDAARTLRLGGSDSGAGVARLEYRLGSGAWTAYTAPVRLGSGATTVQHRGVDALGNVETAGALRVPAAAGSTRTLAVAPASVRLAAVLRVTARVSAAGRPVAGTVRLQRGARVLATARLQQGRASLAVRASRLGVGRHALTVTYVGSSSLAGSRDAVTVRVTRR